MPPVGQFGNYRFEQYTENDAEPSNVKEELQEKFLEEKEDDPVTEEKQIYDDYEAPLETSQKTSGNKDLNEVLNELIEKNGDVLSCKACGKVSKTTSAIRLHVEIHIEGLSFDCKFCHQSFRSRMLLYKHTYKTHSK